MVRIPATGDPDYSWRRDERTKHALVQERARSGRTGTGLSGAWAVPGRR